MESLFLAHSFNVSQELCFACGSTASHGHLRPLGRDQASGPQAQARILFTLGALEKMLGFADVIVRDGVDHGARPRLVGRTVADRPHLTQLSSCSTWRSLATWAFGQQPPVAAESNAPYMAWFSRVSKNRKCCLMMDTSQPLSKPAPSQWVAARAQCTERMSRDKT